MNYFKVIIYKEKVTNIRNISNAEFNEYLKKLVLEERIQDILDNAM